jgi:hypothetical protein
LRLKPWIFIAERHKEGEMIILTEARKRGMRSITRHYVIGMIDWDECVEILGLQMEAAREETPGIIFEGVVLLFYVSFFLSGILSFIFLVIYDLAGGYVPWYQMFPW